MDGGGGQTGGVIGAGDHCRLASALATSQKEGGGRKRGKRGEGRGGEAEWTRAEDTVRRRGPRGGKMKGPIYNG